jgi:hypothetical protein
MDIAHCIQSHSVLSHRVYSTTQRYGSVFQEHKHYKSTTCSSRTLWEAYDLAHSTRSLFSIQCGMCRTATARPLIGKALNRWR